MLISGENKWKMIWWKQFYLYKLCSVAHKLNELNTKLKTLTSLLIPYSLLIKPLLFEPIFNLCGAGLGADVDDRCSFDGRRFLLKHCQTISQLHCQKVLIRRFLDCSNRVQNSFRYKFRLELINVCMILTSVHRTYNSHWLKPFKAGLFYLTFDHIV